MQRPPRRWALVVLAGYAAALAVVLLQPSAGAAIHAVGGVADWLRELGAPRSVVTNDRVEFVLNALMVAPVTFLGAWVLPRVSVVGWCCATLVASGLVEAVQGLFLVERDPQLVDVLGNSAGGALGAAIALAFGAGGAVSSVSRGRRAVVSEQE